MSQANGRSMRGMEAGFSPVEQSSCGLSERIPIGPRAMAGELLLQEPPDALQEVQVRPVRRQPEGEAPGPPGPPTGCDRRRTVIAELSNTSTRSSFGPASGRRTQKGGETGPSFLDAVCQSTRPEA